MELIVLFDNTKQHVFHLLVPTKLNVALKTAKGEKNIKTVKANGLDVATM